MPSKVATHFEEYREQTRIKHEILTRYLVPYFTIRSAGAHDNLVYIDGFAGAGSYAGPAGAVQFGSPLLALDVFATKLGDVAGRVSSIFIESDGGNFASLVQAVADYGAAPRGLREPRVVHGTFESEVDALLSGLRNQGKRLAPSFLFADPCGITGLSFATLCRYMHEGDGETLLFFNYDGVNRVAGAEFEPGGPLSRLIGGDDRARALSAQVAGQDPRKRQETILEAYFRALGDEIKDVFCTAFPVEYKDRRATSHYLMHLSRNAKGFHLMKEVMWPLGETVEGKGALELQQASRSDPPPLFRLSRDRIKAAVLRELDAAGGPVPVRHFYVTLSEQRGNRLCRPAYKEALLDLEALGKVDVFDKHGARKPAGERRKHKGESTLGEDYSVARSRS